MWIHSHEVWCSRWWWHTQKFLQQHTNGVAYTLIAHSTLQELTVDPKTSSEKDSIGTLICVTRNHTVLERIRATACPCDKYDTHAHLITKERSEILHFVSIEKARIHAVCENCLLWHNKGRWTKRRRLGQAPYDTSSNKCFEQILRGIHARDLDSAHYYARRHNFISSVRTCSKTHSDKHQGADYAQFQVLQVAVCAVLFPLPWYEHAATFECSLLLIRL